MKLPLVAFLVACAIGYAAGGRLQNLADVQLRTPWLVFAGLLLQLLPLPPAMRFLSVPILMGSFVLLLAFAVLNVRVAGFALILIGVALNFVVIAVNNGMPVSPGALVSSGQRDTLSELTRNEGAKHHLLGPGDRLVPLADVISLGPQVHQIVSWGDVATYSGAAWFVAGTMIRRRRTEPQLEAPAVGEAA